MAELDEVTSAPITPRPPISAPPSQLHSPSLTRSPLLSTEDHPAAATTEITRKTPKTPRSPRTPNVIRTPRFITPIASPIRRALHLTRLDPQDAWLPITESRNGNAYYAAFHTLCSGIGIQALILPVAFTILGWTWAIICLTLAFIWQLYTLYLLVQLHENTETMTRYCRYLQLASATFGERLAKILAGLPIIYLSGGTCVALIILGGSTSRTFYQILCGQLCTSKPLTTAEWYLVFTCAAVLLSQLPNLNSIAGISLVGAITAVGYCSFIWITSVAKGRLPGVSYNPVKSNGQVADFFAVLNALGIIAFAFRGHNLVLEIQSTMPSSEKHPSRVPMWRGVKIAYTIIALCLFPLAIGGYWAYGQKIPQAGMLTAFYKYHRTNTSQFILGLTSLFVIVNAVSSFQIYGMPMFDELESQFTKRRKKPCPWWLRVTFRFLFGFICFFVAVAIPFLGSVSGLIGGLSLPVTLSFPCFMWLKVKKPKVYGPVWWINWILGIVGIGLSALLISGGVYTVIDNGTQLSFFKPQ
ncbi:Amino acid transporter, transmembrane domain [Dillenia turbinata]|uniref:Amino acid transporter, transmembrane domain n=1 Tax=Dillenia turbinata TaxID=194707 RepID=A0AAN8WEK6_9MAGN